MRAGLDMRGVLPDAEERICRCLLVAFSDHLARGNDRGTRRCKMVHDRSGELSVKASSRVNFVAAEIEERELRGDVSVLLGLATRVEVKWLEETFLVISMSRPR